MSIQITITNAGRAEIINAANTGTAPVTITHVGVGTGQYVPAATQTALQAETKRLATIAGQVVADDTIHVTIKDESNDVYNVSEFGLFTESGTLFAVYSQTTGPFMQKAGPSTLLLSVDILLGTLDANNITFGDTSFSNPPASETTPGVVQISTLAEALAGTAVPKAVPPHVLKAVIDQVTAEFSAKLDGGDMKASVRVASTANIANLAGGTPSALDGIALALNDRILVKDQTTPAQNGIYVVTTLGTGANGTWTRATDADTGTELNSGALIAVEQGSTHADTLWMLTTDGPITIGTTPLTFARKDSATARQIQPIGASVAANALTVTVQPTTLDFRDATLSSGTVYTRTLAAAASLTVPSGATLGTVNGQLSRLVVLLLDNAGTLEPAIVNLAGGVSLDETGVISSTAISGAANSASVVYSQSARANLPYRVVGVVESTQAAAGTWATAPSRVQGTGGHAFAAMQSLGFGQTWQSVTRSPGVTYYNTTGRPIQLMWNINASGAASCSASVSINGGVSVVFSSVGAGTGPTAVVGNIIIPPGASYVVTEVNVTARSTFELR